MEHPGRRANRACPCVACLLAGNLGIRPGQNPGPAAEAEGRRAGQAGLQLNDREYFETRGLNVLVFTNQYNGMFFDEKTAGIEIIQNGVRLATGGAVRLSPTPEQWDQIPKVVERKVDQATKTITCVLRYEAFDFNSRLVVTPEGAGVRVAVYVDTPVPEKLEGRAGLNLEFLPSTFFERTYLADGKPGIFPRYPIGPTETKSADTKIRQFEGYSTFDDRGRNEYVEARPVAAGKSFVLAPEDPEHRIAIQSFSGDLQLLDGRNLAQNGWFIVRTLLTAKTTGKVAEWLIRPNVIPNWTRTPVIGFSQVGYHPTQKKVAIIELDQNDTALPTASLFEVTADGAPVERLTPKVQPWGPYLRYKYATADFSAVTRPGLYYIQYGKQRTETFPIGQNVYDTIWHATSDVWFPVQMDHMAVNEAYRVWHGLTHMDDALQAPLNFQHFDGYGWARRRTRSTSPSSASPVWLSAAGSTPATSTSRAARTRARSRPSWTSGRPSSRCAIRRSSIRRRASSTSTARTARPISSSRSNTARSRWRLSTGASAS